MSDAPSRRAAADRFSRLALFGVLVAGIAARVAGAWMFRLERSPDYAVVVQMARHMAAGREWPVFYYGQPYMGSLEPAASALLVAVFGPAPFWVCLGTALFGVALLFAMYRWAADLGGRWAGVLAVAAGVVGPIGYFQYTASPRGGYALGLLLTVLLLREGSRLAWQSRERGGVSSGHCARLGLLGGLAFWNFWLALPALAAAGVALVGGLRWRILRFRVWFPGLLGFAAGSWPFWWWNARNDWASLGSWAGYAGRWQALQSAWLLVVDRVPLLLDVADGVSAARTAVVLTVYVVLTVLAVLTLRPRRGAEGRRQPWALATVALFALFFVAAYTLSMFGSFRTPRYLLPLFPVFAVLSGVAVVQSVRSAWAARRTGRGAVRGGRFAVAVAGVACWGIAVIACGQSWPRHFRSQAWFGGARELADRLADEGVDCAVGDYAFYGINWATDERLCVSSPESERYARFRQRVELADHPAVLENFCGFDHFIASTGASAVYEDDVGGCRVHSRAVAPALAAVPVAEDVVRGVRDDAGADRRSSLMDHVLSTAAVVGSNDATTRWLDIEFAQPVTVCGARVWVQGRQTFAAWSIEGRVPGSQDYRELSPSHVDSGYYWSGPRFYWGGVHRRTEKRFAPVVVTGLRVRFEVPGLDGAVRVQELQALRPDGDARVPDVGAIAAAVRLQGLGRVYADRWLANQLHAALGGVVWTSREPDVFDDGGEGPAVRCQLGVGIAAESTAVASVRQALALMGVAPQETEVGGVTLFTLPRVSEAVSGYCGLRFSGAALMHTSRSELSDLRLAQAGEAKPGEREATLRAALEISPGNIRALLALAGMAQAAGRAEEGKSLRQQAIRAARAEIPMNAAVYDDNLVLLGVSAWPASVRPGTVFCFEAKWRMAQGFRPPTGLVFVAHFLRGRQIVFQNDRPFAVEPGTIDPPSDVIFSTHHTVVVPAGTAPGVVTPALGLYMPGLLGRRVAVETDGRTLQRRVVVPALLEVVP